LFSPVSYSMACIFYICDHSFRKGVLKSSPGKSA
jgi:hypothetical protein